jgi:tetratricopeptide (TPR) repeat protein
MRSILCYESSTFGFFVALFLTVGAVGQNEQRIPKIVTEAAPSVLTLTIFDAKGNRLSRGTGFVIGNGRLITNYHAIDGGAAIEAQFANGPTIRVSKVVTKSQVADLAILEAAAFPPGAKPLRFSSVPPRIGERIVVIGAPRGLEGSASDGIVAAIRKTSRFGTLVQITAPISPGSSGSPVLNMDGEVIGVATINVEGGQNLNFAISSESVLTLAPDLLRPFGEPNSVRRRWRLLDTKVLYDSQTLRANKVEALVWVRLDKSDGSNDLLRFEISCLRSQLRALEGLYYNSEGKVTRAFTGPGEWSEAAPDSLGEVMFGVFCKGEKDLQYYTDDQRVSDLLDLGKKAEESGNYAEAIQAYLTIIDEAPDWTVSAYLRIAVLYRKRELFSQAERYAAEAIRIGKGTPNEHKAYFTLATILEAKCDWKGAEKAYWDALRIEECEILCFAQTSLEISYSTKGDEQGEIKLFEFLLERRGFTNFVKLAELYDKQGMKSRARSLRQDGLRKLKAKIAENSTEFDYYDLASLQRSLGQIVPARNTLRNGIRKFPSDLRLLFSFCESLAAAREWQTLVEIVESHLVRSASYPERYLKIDILQLLEKAYLQLNRSEDLRRTQERLLTLKTENPK